MKRKDLLSSFLYTNERGDPLYLVEYFTDGTFHYMLKSSKKGYKEGMPGHFVPYNLQALASAEREMPVYLCGDEFDADMLTGMGLVATCGVPDLFGGHVPVEWGRFFAGRQVLFVESNAPLTMHVAEKGIKALTNLSKLSYILTPQGMQPGESLADWLENMEWEKSQWDDWVIAELERYVAEAEKVLKASPQPPAGSNGNGLVHVGDDGEDRDEKYQVGWKDFPTWCLPDTMSAYVQAIAEAIRVNPAYVALPSLVCAGGLVGNARVLRLNQSWTEPLVFFGCLIADSSTRKSAAMDWAFDPASRLDFEYAKQFKEARKSWKQEDREWTNQAVANQEAKEKGERTSRPIEPLRKRILVEDITVETIVRELEANPRGLVMKHDELIAWFKSFGRYKSGGSSGGDFSFWLKAFRAAGHTYDRKSGDQTTVIIHHAALSVFGTIQPKVMSKVLTRDYFDSGFTSRLLLMMPPKQAGEWLPVLLNREVMEKYDRLFKKLHELDKEFASDPDNQPREIIFTEEANKVWSDFYNPWQKDQYHSEGDVTSLMAKLEAYCARFAALFAICDSVEGRTDTCDVDAGHVERAVTLTRWFKDEAERVYAFTRMGDNEQDDERLIEKIDQCGGVITARQLYLKNKSRYRSTDGAKAVLLGLVDAKKLFVMDRIEGRHVGQATTYFTTQQRSNAATHLNDGSGA